MRFLVVTLAPTLLKEDGHFYSYAPYVKEMNIWFSAADTVAILSPNSYKDALLLAPFNRKDIEVQTVPTIAFNSFGKAIVSVLSLPYIFFKLFREFSKADHIHLRCPGNMGLLGTLVQIFFPKKTKTAKYAGNWDPSAKQPLSYRLQKWLLNNTTVTKNMHVLVYGNWPNQSKNVKPFFTASYPKSKIEVFAPKKFSTPLKFIFVGTLSPGKRPDYILRLMQQFKQNTIDVKLDVYGDGFERLKLAQYVKNNGLSQIVIFHGNQSAERIEKVYKESDFLILPSKSEGWPKVVAEAMFWGVIPIATKISCVPWMLDYGKRGILIDAQLEHDVQVILSHLEDHNLLQEMSRKAMEWSHSFTIDDFESEIKKIL